MTAVVLSKYVIRRNAKGFFDVGLRGKKVFVSISKNFTDRADAEILVSDLGRRKISEKLARRQSARENLTIP